MPGCVKVLYRFKVLVISIVRRKYFNILDNYEMRIAKYIVGRNSIVAWNFSRATEVCLLLSCHLIVSVEGSSILFDKRSSGSKAVCSSSILV